MISRRPLAIFLIVFGLGVIAVVLFWLILPLFRSQETPAAQPPPLQDTVVEPTVPTEPVPFVPPISINLINQQERQAQDALRRFSQEFASRAGTYSNADGFLALKQVYLQSTPELQVYLENVRQQLTQAHGPLQGPWGQTTRGLASRITSPLPLANRTEAQVVVQAQVMTETLQGADPADYKEIILSLVRSSPSADWKVSRIEVQELP